MWICPECDSKVDDDQSQCNVCGTSRREERHAQAPSSILNASNQSQRPNGWRQDLACVFVRGFGLYLIVQAFLELPNVITSFAAASEFTKQTLNIGSSGTGMFRPLVVGLAVGTAAKLVCGIFLLTKDVVIQFLARAIRS